MRRRFWILDSGLWIEAQRRTRASGLSLRQDGLVGNPRSKVQNAKCARRSFTLIEVLIAIALILALSGAMFGFLWDMLDARARALERAMQQRTANTLIERLEGDLAGCLVGDRSQGAGVSGDEGHLRILSRGVAVNLAERGVDDPDVFGDLQFAEYRFDAPARRIEGRRGPARAVAATAYQPLAGVIPRMRFRYHDGVAWVSSFDSLAADRLPIAIEVAIWFNPWPEDVLLADSLAPPPPDGLADADAAAREDALGQNFDERQFALASDVEFGGEPRPDRLRVFALLDAAAPADEGGGE